MSLCTLCPRSCAVDRSVQAGACGCTDEIKLSRVMIHKWEEPCICTGEGSGAVFFCGCPLGCVYCQNGDISKRSKNGTYAGEKSYTEAELADEFLRLQQKGACNIDLVSPTQYTTQIIKAVSAARTRGLSLPIVWNTGGYETVENIQRLDGTVDVYLTDIKYFDSELSGALSYAPDYFERAFSALLEMTEQLGKPIFEHGALKRGVIVRHLVLPGCRRDSEAVLKKLAEPGLADKVVLSLMSQYTPEFFGGCADEKLAHSMKRRVTSFEYDSVSDLANRLGFTGYGQERSSAATDYTPAWGIFEY